MNKKNLHERRLIKKDIQILIREGLPKQQILNDLSAKYKDKITIVRQLELTPSMVMRKKYVVWNCLLAALLLVMLVIDSISIKQIDWNNWVSMITLLNVVLDIVFLIGVLLYMIETYTWIAARAVITILQMLVFNAYYHQPVSWNTWVVLSLGILAFLLGFYLSIKLCPPRIPTTIEVDIDDSEKIKKTVYVFAD